MGENELQKRLFEFGVHVLKFLPKLPDTPEFRMIRFQLAKSCTSSGANYEEAQAGSSLADFNHKVHISLREMRESAYWMKIIAALLNETSCMKEIMLLNNEAEQLRKILGSIAVKTSSKTKANCKK